MVAHVLPGRVDRGDVLPRRHHTDPEGGVDKPAPGDFAGGHQFSVDSAGNLYVANFRQGLMKFVPKGGADKSRLIGQPY